MKGWVKGVLYAAAPRWTTALMSARARAHSHRVLESWGCGRLNCKLIERFGNRVQEGAFAGLVLTPMASAEQIGPYLLGVYESELDGAWDSVLRGAYPQILDIGAKFGYYAVGLAKHYPSASVIAFDTDWWARKAVRQMAAANGVTNVGVKGFCSRNWLVQNTMEGAFIISDCEGYEAVLFAPDVVSRLRTATLVIETHDSLVPGVSDRLRAAFENTHIVQTLGHAPSRRSTSRPIEFLSEQERQLAVQEVRSPQLWLLCLPKAGPNLATPDMK